MKLEPLRTDDSRIDVRYVYKIKNPDKTNPDGSGMPMDFRIRLKSSNFFRVDPAYIDNGDPENPYKELDPNRYIVYKNAETVQAFIIIDQETNTVTLRIPKKSGHFTPKTEKLKTTLSRWLMPTNERDRYFSYAPRQYQPPYNISTTFSRPFYSLLPVDRLR